MEEKNFSYDWAAYYQAAYEKEKKKNTLLAGRIADTQVKEEELRANLERIEKSIFWKLSAPFRKCYYAVSSGNKGGKSSNTKITDVMKTKPKACQKEYQQEVFRQKHPYLQWIAENEGAEAVGEYEETAFINGWQKKEIPGTDLCIIICGKGILCPRNEEIIKSWFNNHGNCLFAYADEDYYYEDISNRMHPWFKPGWSPDTLLSFCYIGHMVVVRKSFYHGFLEGDKAGRGDYADFYKLCLMLEERAATLEDGDRLARSLQADAKAAHDRVGNIEQVLFHNLFEPDEDGVKLLEEVKRQGADVLEAAEKLLQTKLEQGYDMEGCGAEYSDIRLEALKRRGIKARLQTGSDPDIYNVCYDINITGSYRGKAVNNMVSVIIPSKDHPDLLKSCLSSFKERTEYGSYEFVIVDNGSSEANKALVEELCEEYGCTYVYEPMDFNFSAMCNLGAKYAKGDYLLFLNDDIEVIEKDWLGIMLGQAQQPHVGAVGAKLWYAGSNIIQHAGITNMGIGPSHKLASLTDNKCYYYGRNLLTYDVIGVTAACLMIEKRKYFETGGMDESMKVAYNDVDLCFRLIESGYYNVLRNDAVLFHHESMSRGLDSGDDAKWERLLEEKEVLYEKHPDMKGKDIFYNSGLNDDNVRYACNYKYEHMLKDKTVRPVKSSIDRLRKAKRDAMHLTVDSAGLLPKGSREEEDIIEISGWSYIAGEDNSRYIRSVLLQKDEIRVYTAEPFAVYREDVEKALTDEVNAFNALLAGFVLRIPAKELGAGCWKIGMLAEDAEHHRKFLAWSDKVLKKD